ncbi:flagellar biosynthesis protein [Halomonas borealis]|uniref:flagellar biosynthesis protein n=1 Tax=Halomonas borealis TaxID=2508710 RepID=UPI0010A043FA|nr:flagellar biosynthesis protein [Halomonas borealis]
MKFAKIWVSVLAFLTITGCATSRSVVPIDVPVARDGGVQTESIFIESVVDNRTFEEAPRIPSTPSLGFDGANAASDEMKARAIGRKRNGYGKALGDVFLPENQTVEELIRKYATAAFNDAGWRVVDNAGADQTVAIQIDELWAWFKPGFWAITLNSNVSTTLKFVRNGVQIPVSVHVEDTRQMATEGAWKEIVEMALEEYRGKVRASVPMPR